LAIERIGPNIRLRPQLPSTFIKQQFKFETMKPQNQNVKTASTESNHEYPGAPSPLWRNLATPAVIIASLGYFVDIFDLLLFSIVRKPSLASLGLDEAAQVTQGLFLHNLQMTGMLIGGILWGVLADKRGRLSVLFGSILLYSVGNLANAFVHSVEAYALCRLIAGIGLAGELGAGITLVAETLSKEHRGYGTMIVATVGVSGAVVAGLIGEFFDWRTTYIIGGVLGLALLLLRINTAESMLFQNAEQTDEARGNFFSLFTQWGRFRRLALCVLSAVPIWFVIGTLVQLAPELAHELGVTDPITAGRAILFCYSGLVFGDFASGALSQWVKSRVKVIVAFIAGMALTTLYYFNHLEGAGHVEFYTVCVFLGFFAGYWAVFVTVAAEQFGTNLRGTVATSAPNFVRASVVPMSFAFTALKPEYGIPGAAQWVGAAVMAIALFAALRLQETFGKDLGYFEVD
jgi:putative MFS transporter